MEELLVREVKHRLVEKCSQSTTVLSASFYFESGNQPIKMNPFTFTTPQMEAQGLWVGPLRGLSIPGASVG